MGSSTSASISTGIEFLKVETTSGSRELQISGSAWAHGIATSGFCPCCGDPLEPMASGIGLWSQKDRYWGRCARDGNIYTAHDPHGRVYAYGCDASVLPCSLVGQCSRRVRPSGSVPSGKAGQA